MEGLEQRLRACSPLTIALAAEAAAEIERLKRERDEARALLKEVEAALEPFARACAQLDNHNPSPLYDDETAPIGQFFCMGELRDLWVVFNKIKEATDGREP